MIRLFFGKSGSGKDYWCQKNVASGLNLIVPYTTRPKRETETDGKDYHFVMDSEFAAYQNAGLFMETRSYEVLLDNRLTTWKYATPLLNEEDLKKDWCCVTTIPVCRKFIDLLGADLIELIFVECNFFVREQRVQQRGTPLDAEWERRKLADDEDFSRENILALCNFYKKPIEVIHNSLDRPTFSKIWPEKWEGTKNGTI